MRKQEYLSLMCIDKSKNKMRTYVIQILFFDAYFTVIRFRGRLHHTPIKMEKQFIDQVAMKTYVEGILKKRMLSRYEIIEKSIGFPESPTLLLFGLSEFKDVQGKLL